MPAPQMSSQLENTSAILGEYMLKGWTLTDLHCAICRVTPLMREPTSQAERAGRNEPIQFCALCDGAPTGRPAASSSTSASIPPIHSSSSAPAAPTASVPGRAPVPTGTTGSRQPAAGAGPAPDLSFGSSSTADDAASKISGLLLQGYSLLGDNCPSDTCRGMPLVGYPRKRDGSKDTRRLCVGCGGRWVTEGDTGGMTMVSAPTVGGAGPSAAVKGVSVGSAGNQQAGASSPNTRRRMELYDVGLELLRQEEKMEEEEQVDEVDMDVAERSTPSQSRTPQTNGSSALPAALRSTTDSLAQTLDRLATSLSSHTSGSSASDESRYFVDVKLHTEAMRDVLEVLERLERLGK
ncbi:hypothetical protein EHS25_006940 [Saitozyma podzolica]|uniref:Uncharacterized protein n=1 Tax=Saitozyma podzolica TaxID=1890683 RepID=A0A427XRI4_9TREE|nr:hypothetical protein EHS25_006940 [Saitozyma podzolica]